MEKCKYYPCHNLEGMDCKLCYCPFYSFCPTLDNATREYANIKGYWLNRSMIGKPPVWACEKCIFPHIKEIADIVEKYGINADPKEVLWDCLNKYKELDVNEDGNRGTH